MGQNFDIVIIGGGIAGFSAACFIAEDRGDGSRIAVIERESQPGYHATGRSAAMYTEIYGNDVIRKIVRAGRAFLETPPAHYHDRSFLSPRGALMTADAGRGARIDEFMAELNRPDVLTRVDTERCLQLSPRLNPERISGGIWEPSAMDIDVNSLLQAYVRVYRGAGGHVIADADVRAIAKTASGFRIETGAGSVKAGIVVNAAGAWGDDIAAMAGAARIGLTPKRRTVITFDPPAGVDHRNWPMVVDIDEQGYFKPDAGRILASPADQTPTQASDVQPEEIDIAVCIDRIEQVTALRVGRPASAWAGLRSFVEDQSPVNGWDDKIEGFYWLVGQGGYGIKTSPGMGRMIAARIAGRELPAELLEFGLDPASLSVERLRRKHAA